MGEIFGELEHFGAEYIYPNRFIILPIVGVAIVAALAAAWKLRLYVPLMRHPYITGGVTVVLLAVGIPVGWYLLSPLWERSFLEEAGPDFDRSVITRPADDDSGSADPPDTATEAPSDADGDGDASSEPDTSDNDTSTDRGGGEAASGGGEAASGGGDGAGGGGSGESDGATATLYAFGEWIGADDFHFARGDAFILETEPGVYILRVENFSVRNGPGLVVMLSPSPDDYEVEAIELGDLKATDGAFSYEIPPDVDINKFRSAIVWCKPFSVLFGYATLEVVTQ